jgi:hypothetical protein
MSATGTSLYIIPGNVTDEMLINILKKELPGALLRMNINKPLSNATIDDLAYYLADYVKSCNKTDSLRELKGINLASQPTVEQCNELKEFLDQIVRIRTVSPDHKVNKHMIRNLVGRIWKHIAPDIDKSMDDQGRYSSGGGPGVRG